jgi:hypothetical protein
MKKPGTGRFFYADFRNGGQGCSMLGFGPFALRRSKPVLSEVEEGGTAPYKGRFWKNSRRDKALRYISE